MAAMRKATFTESDDLPRQVEQFDREQLRTTFGQLQLACAAADLEVDGLLRKPAHEVIAFAHVHAIDLRDLRDICDVLLRRLDAFEREFAAVERRQSH
jgi:hypothetical protein